MGDCGEPRDPKLELSALMPKLSDGRGEERSGDRSYDGWRDPIHELKCVRAHTFPLPTGWPIARMSNQRGRRRRPGGPIRQGALKSVDLPYDSAAGSHVITSRRTLEELHSPDRPKVTCPGFNLS